MNLKRKVPSGAAYKTVHINPRPSPSIHTCAVRTPRAVSVRAATLDRATPLRRHGGVGLAEAARLAAAQSGQNQSPLGTLASGGSRQFWWKAILWLCYGYAMAMPGGRCACSRRRRRVEAGRSKKVSKQVSTVASASGAHLRIGLGGEAARPFQLARDALARLLRVRVGAGRVLTAVEHLRVAAGGQRDAPDHL
eukprot:scaffold19078_cov61-Phaeocystis_antarctica.AAC.1